MSSEINISIIIPTYNVEKFIGDCLNSLIYQSHEDFEIILVDDCSTDSTVNIIDYYSKKDDRIKYFINTKKSGSGGSRNIGMNHARGKYILFVDADDWLDLNALKELYDLAEKNRTQLLFFKLFNYDDSSKTFIKDNYLEMTCLNKFIDKEFAFKDINDELFDISVVPYNKLYSRSFLEKIGAKFPEKYIHQDNPFFYKVFCEAERIYLVDKHYYNRRLWQGSITTLRDDTELGTIEIVEEILKVFIDNNHYEKFKELLLNRLLFKLRNRFNLVGEDYKEEYILRTNKKLKRFMFDYDLFNDLNEYLLTDNKLFFESVLYSEDYEEFCKSDYVKNIKINETVE